MKRLLFLLALGVAAAPAWAKAPAHPIHFVAPASIDIPQVLPPPPANGSLAAAADLETVLRMQADRTPAQIEWAKEVAAAEGNPMLPNLSATEYPKTTKLIEEVFDDLHSLSTRVKKIYARPRPPAADPAVHPCVEVPKSYSYPSGHTLSAYTMAAVCSLIIPQRKAEFYDRAHRFAWGRVIGGVHFPTDLAGGRILAQAFVSQLEKNPDFQAEVTAAKAEWAAAPVAP